MSRPKGSDLERFWSKVEKAEGDACWMWTGARYRGRYGQFQMGGRPHVAHRASWMLNRGVIERGLVIRHLCGNAGCVRPDHLQPGTRKENTADDFRHGTMPHPYNPWLTLNQVAQMLGLSPATLRQQIKRGKIRGLKLAGWHIQLREVERYRATNLRPPDPPRTPGR